jgi:hypothetical protein
MAKKKRFKKIGRLTIPLDVLSNIFRSDIMVKSVYLDASHDGITFILASNDPSSPIPDRPAPMDEYNHIDSFNAVLDIRKLMKHFNKYLIDKL